MQTIKHFNLIWTTGEKGLIFINDLKQHLFSDFVNLYFHPRIFISLEETEDDQLDYRDFQKILGKGNEDLIDDIIQLVVADQFFQ